MSRFLSFLRSFVHLLYVMFGPAPPEDEIRKGILEVLTRAGSEGRHGWQIARELDIPRPGFYRVLSIMFLDDEIVRVPVPRDPAEGWPGPPRQIFYIKACAPARAVSAVTVRGKGGSDPLERSVLASA